MSTVTVDWNSMPSQKSFILKQADSLNYPVQLKIKTESATTYSNFNLTSCTLTLWVKKGGTAVISGTTITPDAAASGTFTVLITAAQTAAWTGEYSYEVQLVCPTGNTYFPSGATKTILEGVIKMRDDLG